MSGFLQALPVTLAFEGGFVVDSGGPTYQGVTQDVFDDYLRVQNLPARSVKEVTEEERDHLYYVRYWIAAKCDKLPWPLSMVHFDCAVNSGVSRAIKVLQLASGAFADGAWGPATQERIGLESHDIHALMEKMLWCRVEFYQTLAHTHPTHFGQYFLGWVRRVTKLRRKAFELW